MKFRLALFALLLLPAISSGQSVSLGLSAHRLPFAALETKIYGYPISRSKDWRWGSDVWLSADSHGLGWEPLALDHRFKTIKLVGVPVANMYLHFGLGAGLFSQSRGLRASAEFGLTFR